MADNSLVTPQVWSIERGIRERTQDKQQLSPRFIPVTVTKIAGEAVTVKAQFVNKPYTINEITIPQAYSQWIREPTQVGDKGWAVAADYYLGGQSGFGGGTANYRDRPNLTTLVFIPVSQKQFSHNTERNLNAVFINGPQGAVIQDQSGHTVLTIDGSNFDYKDNKGNELKVDTSANKIIIKLGSGMNLYLGGDGSTGTYGQVATTAGNCQAVYARVDAP